MKSRRKNILRGIRKNLNRFLSILFIVAIGSGFMAGLAATSPDMYDTADKYIDDNKLYDIDIKCPLGADEEDIAAIKSLGITESIKGLYQKDMVLSTGEKQYTARVMALLGENGETNVNKTVLEDGRYPEKTGECVVESYMGKYQGDSLGIGSTLHFSEENQDYDDIRDISDTEELTVVGIVASPMRIGIENDATNVGAGSIGINVYTLKSQFDVEEYTDIYVYLKETIELNAFSEEYKEIRDASIEKLEERMDERTEIRKKDLYKKLDDALEDINSIEKLYKEIAERSDILAEEFLASLDTHQEAMGILGGTSFEGTLSYLEENYHEGETYLDDRLEYLDEKRDEIEENREKIGDVSYMIRTRNDLACIKSYDSNVGKVGALSKVFPVFFFLVALLVALTTMTRLVEENRIQIGTLKALGFSNGQILSEYILFSMLSSVIGCVLGFTIGFWLFPFAINSAYSMLYFLPPISTPVRWNIVLMVAPVTIGSILLATLVSCWNEFRACPAQLMVPKAPASGKRIFLEHITFIWKRLPFSLKVTCRNIFRYKKRFFMTIIGVAGCSALLLTGFGIRDSISDIVDKQYGDIDKYELTIVLAEPDKEMDDKLKGFLADESVVENYGYAHSENGRVLFDGSTEKLSIMVLKNEEDYGKLISLHNRKSREELTPKAGIVLTEKLSETIGVKKGDTVKLELSEGKSREVEVEGISENYIVSYAYMSDELYTEINGETPEYGMIFCMLTDEAIEDENITGKAMESEGVLNARTSLSLKKNFSDSLNSINGVIWVLIASAGILCAVVLYNLINVNICERRKELATIRVLGFHERETEKYIFRETNILSFIGAVVGLGLGIWLHGFVIKTVEIEKVMFGRDIYPLSFVLAIVITMVFTIIVNRFMGRQIKKVDMAQAMKAND